MADFILARKSRNVASVILHVVLNLLLGLVAVFSTLLLNTPALGIILVLVSKWRMFAVRSRFWWPNIKSNLVDIIVGVSIVLLSYYMLDSSNAVQGAEIWTTAFMAVFYCLWLTVIKPRSGERAALWQSIIAVFLGISATMIGTRGLNSIACTVVAFVIGYAASRHILVQSDDTDFSLSTLCCGLIFAEIAFLCSNWMIVYPICGFGGQACSETLVRIPQAALIMTMFIFVYNYARQAMVKYHDDFRFKHIALPVTFGIIMVLILVATSQPWFNR